MPPCDAGYPVVAMDNPPLRAFDGDFPWQREPHVMAHVLNMTCSGLWFKPPCAGGIPAIQRSISLRHSFLLAETGVALGSFNGMEDVGNQYMVVS